MCCARWAKRRSRRLRAEGNVRDLRTDWRNRELVLRPQVVEERARTIGLTRADIGDALRFATEGVNVGVYREGDTLIPIIARAPEAERAIADNLSDRLIWSPAQNAYVPLTQAVDGFALEARDTLIQRRDRVRTLTVQANPPQGETAASAFVRFSAIAESVELPRGYRLEWGGEHYASQQANESLGGVLPFSLLVMVVTSVLSVPDRAPAADHLADRADERDRGDGGAARDQCRLLLHRACWACLSLSGMLIKNAIVLVDELDQRIRGRAQRSFEAVLEGSVSRMRPVLLAAGTTILGMTPLIFDAFFQGMAVTIISGLAFATVLT
jgi:multidrug efflux pump subunit AcrB